MSISCGSDACARHAAAAASSNIIVIVIIMISSSSSSNSSSSSSSSSSSPQNRLNRLNQESCGRRTAARLALSSP